MTKLKGWEWIALISVTLLILGLVAFGIFYPMLFGHVTNSIHS